MSSKVDKITSITKRLIVAGFNLVDSSVNNWEITAENEFVGHLNFNSTFDEFTFNSYLDEDGWEFVDESTIDNIIKQALTLPDCTGKTLESTIGEDIIAVGVTDSGEIICQVNGDTRCLFNRTPENVLKNSRVLREAVRLFKQLAEPGVWCTPESADDLGDRRYTFFQKLGFKERENGLFAL